MRKFPVGRVALAIAGALGLLWLLFALGALALPFGLGRSTVVMERLPTGLLGRMLFGPVAPHFVADSRPRYGLIGGAEFYPEPILAGQTLCRVPVHQVSGLYFQGRSARPEASTVLQRYGIAGGGSSVSCAGFRDFANMFEYVGVGEPEDAVVILAQAKKEAADGSGAKVTCEALRKRVCDGQRAFEALDVRHLAGVEMLRHERVAETTWMTHRYAVHLGGNRARPWNLEIIIRSRKQQEYASVLEQGAVIDEVHIKSLGSDLDHDG